MISSNKTYMLTKNGSLLETGDYHPYINVFNGQPVKTVNNQRKDRMLVRSKDLNWYIKNSQYSEKAKQCLERVSDIGTKGFSLIKSNLEPFLELETLTNEEFCRIRTSNVKFPRGGENGEIYFRISSHDFNWFDLIWKTVIENKSFIKYVTIVKDITIGTGREQYYIINGQKTYQMPVEEFLTASGNPVIK